jgi:PIN domain nuclease of toxin-antitoxin system
MHAALWYVLANPALSIRAKSFIDEAGRAGAAIAVSTISLAEIISLIEKQRLPVSAYHDLKAVLEDTSSVLKEISVHAGVVDAMHQVPRDQVPDMPDRIIAATGISLGVPVISRDGRVRASTIETIW